MEDEALVPLDCKGLGNLRVVDLKQELEKRGLSKSGSKKDLVKRLKQQLEFEKLSRDRKSSGDYDLKLELDADIEQNEFVQQYLAQQQKRKEEKRLQLEAIEKESEEKLRDSSEEQVTEDENIISESAATDDDKNNEIEYQIQKSTIVHGDVKNSDTVHDTIAKALAKAEDSSSALESDHLDKKNPASPVDISESVKVEEKEDTSQSSSDLVEAESNDKNSIYSFVDVKKHNVPSSEDESGIKKSKLRCSTNFSLPSADLEIKENASYPPVVLKPEYHENVIKVSEDSREQENKESINDANNSDTNISFRGCHETVIKVSNDSGKQVNINDTVNSDINIVLTECHEIVAIFSEDSKEQENQNSIDDDNSNTNVLSKCPESVIKVSEDFGEQKNHESTNDASNSDVNIVLTEYHETVALVSEGSKEQENQKSIDDAIKCPESVIEVSKDSGEQKNHENTYDASNSDVNIVLTECHETMAIVSKDSKEQENQKSTDDANISDTNIVFTTCPESVIEVSEDSGEEKNQGSTGDANNSDVNIVLTEYHETVAIDLEDSKEQKSIDDANNSDTNIMFTKCPESVVKVSGNSGEQKIQESTDDDNNSDVNIVLTKCHETATLSEDSKEQENQKNIDDANNSDTSIVFTKCPESVIGVSENSGEQKNTDVTSNSDDIIMLTECHGSMTKVSEDSAEQKNQESFDDTNNSFGDSMLSQETMVRVSKNSVEQENQESTDDTNNSDINIMLTECHEIVAKVPEDSRKLENLESIDDVNNTNRNTVYTKSPESVIKDSEDQQNQESSNNDDNSNVKIVSAECHDTVAKVSEDSGSQENIDDTNNSDINIVLTECRENVTKISENSESIDDTKNSDLKIVLTETVTKMQGDEDNNKIPRDVSSLDISENAESVEHPVDIIGMCEQNKQSLISSDAATSEKSSAIESSCVQYFISTMESSQCAPVPYSLSDIQLPESPGNHCSKSSKSVKNEGSSSKPNSFSKEEAEKDSNCDTKAQPNGMTVSEPLDSHHDEVSSEPEIKESCKNEGSPEKIQNEKKESDDNRQSERSESSDAESDRNESHNEKRKMSKYEDTSSNIAVDSEEEQSKDSAYKGQKSKSPQHLGESDNSKSSDSDKHSHVDSKHKSRDKRRKQSRRSRSQSSSSSSHSSDSSPKRRHPKKSVVTKRKNFTENDESNQMSAKSSDAKPANHKNDSIREEQVSVPSTKKRLKIKRDNVSVEINSPSVETVDKAASKNVEKNTLESHSEKSPSKPSKPEPIEPKDLFSEISYVPRKLSLSYRKLSRKSSEDKDSEQKGKKSKWDSFATSQKPSQTISISTDSLKNWFPDFKLISEPTASMELEPDDHSLPTGEEKNLDPLHMDTSEGNSSVVRHSSTSQMEVEEGESEEPNFDEASDQGPVSKIIFIQNLVRPFTLNQLKDLLKQSGKIVEEYFWIDKIKSKCFVMYEAEKEAAKARNALNNTRWPSSNPKILSVEFSNEEELEHHKRGNEAPSKPIVDQPAMESHESSEHRIHQSPEEHKRKDRDRRKDRERSKPQPPVREWDKDKIMQESPEREHTSKDEKSRSAEKKDKKEIKKRPNEDTPAKLLDDLFQKTKSPPCIYWLPLTEEQAKQKEEAQKLRKLEREKRNQQKEQEEAERRNKAGRSSRRSREKENRKSSTRSRSPVSRRR